jgi:hypothetical protein
MWALRSHSPQSLRSLPLTALAAALAARDQACKMDPTNADLWAAFGAMCLDDAKLLAHDGLGANARAVLQKALELRPGHATAAALLAETERWVAAAPQRAGQVEEAEDRLEEERMAKAQAKKAERKRKKAERVAREAREAAEAAAAASAEL